MADIFDDNLFWTFLLIVHGLISVALLGGLTHQTLAIKGSVAKNKTNFIDRFKGVDPSIYTKSICILWIVTFLFGGWIYSKYRINIRIPLEQMGFMKTQGFFELKEHLVTFGLFLLPAYYVIWNQKGEDFNSGKKYLTYLLCAICWFSFLIGHIVNNARGFAQ